MGRTFLDAGAQSTCASPITNAQTTVVLQSTSAFGAPTSILPVDLVILDAGNPAFDKTNPLATNYEYQPATNNNTGTNTLTFNGGVRAAYNGTTPKSFFANAIVAAVPLSGGLNLLPQRFATQTPSSGTSITQTIPSLFRHLEIIYSIAVNTVNTSVFMQLNGDNAAHYYWSHDDNASDGTRAGSGSGATATVSSPEVGFVGSGGNQDCSGRIFLRDIQQTTRHIRWKYECAYDNNAAPVFHDLNGSGLWQPSALAAVNSVFLFISGGQITSSNIDFIGYP